MTKNFTDLMHQYLSTWKYFILGGFIVSGIKFASEVFPPTVAAIIGGIPTGFLAISFLAENKKLGYAQNYYFVTLSLAACILTYYMLLKYKLNAKFLGLKLSEHMIYGIAWCVWLVGVSLKLYIG